MINYNMVDYSLARKKIISHFAFFMKKIAKELLI
jgi:hypothetical protein